MWVCVLVRHQFSVNVSTKISIESLHNTLIYVFTLLMCVVCCEASRRSNTHIHMTSDEKWRREKNGIQLTNDFWTFCRVIFRGKKTLYTLVHAKSPQPHRILSNQIKWPSSTTISTDHHHYRLSVVSQTEFEIRRIFPSDLLERNLLATVCECSSAVMPLSSPVTAAAIVAVVLTINFAYP